MSDRWIPVLAAVVGVIGGLGGAVIGAASANESQESRLKNERHDELEDIRRAAYGNYLGIAESMRGKWAVGKQPKDELEKLIAALGLIPIVGNPRINGASQRVFSALTVDTLNGRKLGQPEKDRRYKRAKKKYLEAVLQDIQTR